MEFPSSFFFTFPHQTIASPLWCCIYTCSAIDDAGVFGIFCKFLFESYLYRSRQYNGWESSKVLTKSTVPANLSIPIYLIVRENRCWWTETSINKIYWIHFYGRICNLFGYMLVRIQLKISSFHDINVCKWVFYIYSHSITSFLSVVINLFHFNGHSCEKKEMHWLNGKILYHFVGHFKELTV